MLDTRPLITDRLGILSPVMLFFLSVYTKK